LLQRGEEVTVYRRGASRHEPRGEHAPGGVGGEFGEDLSRLADV
jgi:hypothetical protein